MNVPVERKPWPRDRQGQDETTALNMAKYVAVGAHSPGIRARMSEALDAAGIPRSERPSVRQCAAAARAWVKENVRYASDPLLAELIQDPRITACTADAPGGACSPMEDCDGHVVVCMSMLASIGITACIFLLDYGADLSGRPIQPHVLGGVQDERGHWLDVDTTTDRQVGDRAPSKSRRKIDPFDPKVAPLGVAGGAYIGVGKPLEPARGMMSSVRGYGEAIFGHRIGAGLVTPGDILAYRAAWNQYVTDTVRVGGGCAQAMLATAQQQTDPALQQALQTYSASLQAGADALLADWNVWANTSDSTIVLQGAIVLQQQQQTVLTAGKLRQTINAPQPPVPVCKPTYVNDQGQVVRWIPGVDPSLQAQIIARIEGLGILAGGILQILVESTGGALQEAGSAASFLGRKSSWLLSPWTWGTAAVLLVGGVAIIAWNADKIGRAAAAISPLGARELRSFKKRGRLAA